MGINKAFQLFHLLSLPYLVHDARFSFKATAEWWAGIEAARQCEGLVGHVVSAATSAIYHSMCFQHAGNYWKCPPYYYFS